MKAHLLDDVREGTGSTSTQLGHRKESMRRVGIVYVADRDPGCPEAFCVASAVVPQQIAIRRDDERGRQAAVFGGMDR